MLEFMKEFLAFLRVRKKLWLAPFMILLVLIAVLLVIAQIFPITPFIYTLF